jgi:choice-of-anchor A domain-containing protein
MVYLLVHRSGYLSKTTKQHLMKKYPLLMGIFCSVSFLSCQKEQLSGLQLSKEAEISRYRRGEVGEAGGRCDFAGNPFAPTLDFEAFIEDSMVVHGKEQKTNLAVGGNFIMANGSQYNVGSNGIGTYKAGNDAKVSALWIGGTIKGSDRLKVQGDAFFKVKKTTNLDCEVASKVLKLKSNGITVLENDAAEKCNDVSQMGSLSMVSAFRTLRNTNQCLAQQPDNVTMDANGNINLTLPTSYITLTREQLNSNIKLKTNADANHVLVINVAGNGQPFHLNGGLSTDTDPAYTMLNITNMPSIHFDYLGSNLKLSILAPDTHAYLDSKEMHGHIVFKNLNQTNKHYMHPRKFKGNIFFGE